MKFSLLIFMLSVLISCVSWAHPIHEAAARDNLKAVVKYLKEEKVEDGWREPELEWELEDYRRLCSVFIFAVLFNKPSIAELFLLWVAEIEPRDETRETPLHLSKRSEVQS